MKLEEATTDKEYSIGVKLFKEYALQIGVNLEFQQFSEEIENIQHHYSRPDGVLFIAYKSEDKPLGCFGVRKLDTATGELKRMYLKEEARGRVWGRQLLKTAIQMGGELTYETMRLDTLPTMQKAVKLYEDISFYEIEPYRFNPIDGTRYMEIRLK